MLVSNNVWQFQEVILNELLKRWKGSGIELNPRLPLRKDNLLEFSFCFAFVNSKRLNFLGLPLELGFVLVEDDNLGQWLPIDKELACSLVTVHELVRENGLEVLDKLLDKDFSPNHRSVFIWIDIEFNLFATRTDCMLIFELVRANLE